ncbi:hypothetical protein Plhal304r1_c031g0100651 [Plasmopara halstedii]
MSSSDSCYKSFQEFRTNTAKFIKITLSRTYQRQQATRLSTTTTINARCSLRTRPLLPITMRKMQHRLLAVPKAVSDKSEFAPVCEGNLLDEINGSPGSNLQLRPFFDKCIEIADEIVKRYDNTVLTSIVREEVLKHSHSASRVEDVYFLYLFSRMISPNRLSNLINEGNEKNTKSDILVENYRQFVDSMGPPNLSDDIKNWYGKIFAAYKIYIRAHNKAKSFAQMKLLPALTARFGDRDTSTMILAAKMHPETAKVAELLEFFSTTNILYSRFLAQI